jgi:hypothetical protein
VQSEREFKVFRSEVLGSPELFADHRFQGNAARVANRVGLHEVINGVLSGLSSEEVLRRLDDAGIANARLRTMAELSAHPQLADRERWRNVESPVGMLRSLIPPVTSQASTIRMTAYRVRRAYGVNSGRATAGIPSTDASRIHAPRSWLATCEVCVRWQPDRKGSPEVMAWASPQALRRATHLTRPVAAIPAEARSRQLRPHEVPEPSAAKLSLRSETRSAPKEGHR